LREIVNDYCHIVYKRYLIYAISAPLELMIGLLMCE
jgi:hypothetical protein